MGGRNSLNRNPNNRNNYIKTSSLVLETPHPVLLVIPVGAAGAVHSASADAGVLIASTPGGEFTADASARGSGGGDGSSRVLGGGGGGRGGAGRGRGGLVVEVALSHVLDDRAVNRELVGRGTRPCATGGGFGDQGAENVIDDGVVPSLSAGMVVDFDFFESCKAGIVGDLLQSLERDR